MAAVSGTPRLPRWVIWTGIPLVLLVLLVAIWRWDWFIPTVEARASAALGRPVTIGHLHLRPGRVITVEADQVVVANPPGWPQGDPPLAGIGRLTIVVDPWSWLRGHGLVLPLIALDRPHLFVAETANGAANFRLATGGGGHGAPPAIGDLRIDRGEARIVVPKLKADFTAGIATEGQGEAARIVADARGTYAAQPITARFTGGALLSLRDRTRPWPLDLALANGPTRLTMRGTVQNPLALSGANVTLRLSGPDMGLLEKLAGFPIPKTPPYQLAGKLAFEGADRIRLDDIRGRMGNSDIEGTIVEQPGAAKVKGRPQPVVTMDLRSRRVELADLSGFIGGEPGRTTTANETPQQRARVEKANASSRLLPDTPISVPRLTWADIHLRYLGERIEGRNIPLDSLAVTMDVVNGRITVHPLSFGIGRGRLLGNFDITPESDRNVRMRADLHLRNVDVARLMAATHTFSGTGLVSGVGAIDATGNSLAALLANGNGEVKMAMAGGDLSALLVDLSGLEFGNALLSALGVPKQTPVECFVADLDLRSGLLRIPAMVLETREAVTNVGGGIDLRSERLDIGLKTDSRHFSVGSLPTRLVITGTLKSPTIRPGAQLAARAGAAAGLGVLFAPLALLPTVQFGTSAHEDARCYRLLNEARATAGGGALPAPRGAETGAKGARHPATR